MGVTITSMATDRIRKGARVHLYIKEWVTHLGLSDEDVASRLGIGRTSFWKQYTDQNRLNPAKVAQIAEALDIHHSQLNYPPGTESLDAIVEAAEPEVRQMAADIVKRMVGKAS